MEDFCRLEIKNSTVELDLQGPGMFLSFRPLIIMQSPTWLPAVSQIALTSSSSLIWSQDRLVGRCHRSRIVCGLQAWQLPRLLLMQWRSTGAKGQKRIWHPGAHQHQIRKLIMEILHPMWPTPRQLASVIVSRWEISLSRSTLHMYRPCTCRDLHGASRTSSLSSSPPEPLGWGKQNRNICFKGKRVGLLALLLAVAVGLSAKLSALHPPTTALFWTLMEWHQ